MQPKVETSGAFQRQIFLVGSNSTRVFHLILGRHVSVSLDTPKQPTRASYTAATIKNEIEHRDRDS